MYQLLLDSSNKYLSVGLAKEGKLIDKIFYEAWQRQSEVMVSEIDNILKRNNLTRKDLDSVAVGRGPGSYTGVRISITIAKTIAFALGIKLYSTSSLNLLRNESEPTLCVFNARSGRSYVAAYDKDGKAVLNDQVMENDQVINFIDSHKDFTLSGELEHLGYKSKVPNILENLALIVNDGNLTDPFELKPIYLKDLMK